MTPENLMIQFGLPIVFFGVMFGGEAFILPAGWLAHQGYIPLPLVILAAALGSFVANQIFFHIGYAKGVAVLQARPQWRHKSDRVRVGLSQYGVWLVLGLRFLFGLRTVLVASFGIAKYSPRKFAALDGIGALVWAVLMTSLGYVFGNDLEAMLASIKGDELWLLATLAVIGSSIWLVHTLVPRRSGLARQQNYPL